MRSFSMSELMISRKDEENSKDHCPGDNDEGACSKEDCSGLEKR